VAVIRYLPFAAAAKKTDVPTTLDNVDERILWEAESDESLPIVITSDHVLKDDELLNESGQ
jgi:hypothetical protein